MFIQQTAGKLVDIFIKLQGITVRHFNQQFGVDQMLQTLYVLFGQLMYVDFCQ